MFSNIYIQQRIKKSIDIRVSNANPYSNDAKKSLNNYELQEKYKDAKDSKLAREDASKNNINEFIAGRIKLIRLMGKAAFIDIEDESGIIQAYLSKNDLNDEFETFKKYAEVGDIVNIGGYPFKTKTNQLSLHATSFKILTKAIIPLPEKFHGLVDVELRYRQRYLDLIMNSKIRDTFKIRSKAISYIRSFFENKGFLEVETPMLHPIPGGANARPFITHHNTLGVDRYLRIAPELYLKRLIIGGMERVFEINRCFRNEGIDHSHNPEFTTIEFYWAYKTYEDLIEITIELLNYILHMLNLSKEIQWGEHKINFNKFNRIPYIESIISVGKIDKDIVNNKDKLISFLIDNKISIDKNASYGKILSIAFDNFVEDKLIQPTFITDFPIEISPLARRNDNNKNIADRFELFIGGKEIANGFSELNDPIDQLERFKMQVSQKEKGDEEAQYMDEDFVWALGYGMPPVAGEGIGIDRLIMLLTNNKTIKEVILFPAMKLQANNFDI